MQTHEHSVISCISYISHSLTCPKTWGKGPERLKALKMINFHSFEHFSLPTFLMKQNKKNWARNGTLIIFPSLNISYSLTCPKTWGKRPKRLKILKMIILGKSEHSSLIISITKQIKTYWVCKYMCHPYNFMQF